MNIQEKLTKIIENMSSEEAISLWNEYCENDYRMDDHIYSMSEFNEIMNGQEPWEIARACYYSSRFCPADNYFWFNGYGNCQSCDFPHLNKDSPFYTSEIVKYILNNENSLNNSDIQDILDDREEIENEQI